MKIKFKEFEAVRWYNQGKLEPREKSIEPEPDFVPKFVVFGSNHVNLDDNSRTIYMIESPPIFLKSGIWEFKLFNKFKHESDKYYLLTQQDEEKYIYSNKILIRILNTNYHYYWDDLPQEIKDQL